ncbi:nitrilase-related carbon-nitrogen hydrolase [Priestia megaterium]|uniref:nitrilase-related carbon-nitrogen hydrolase n=1 Tax=Priestia megaterium TaxID=1404 RepID=UPI00159C4E2C|nr:nitrilase-related carbon-nitrogen hydrolase [Priestia megaterium]
MLRIAAIQMQAQPGQRESNIQTCVKMVEKAVLRGAELVVLPELWISGYYLTKEEFKVFAETPTGNTVTFFQNLAKKLGIVMVVPFVEGEQDQLYISLAVIESTGEVISTYRKSFLWGREKEIFTPGEKAYDVISTSKGKLGLLICADIEFPEPSRILVLKGAELLIVPSVWSYGAETRWDIQLPARALDNTVFVLGVNTVNEGSCGKSKLVSPFGEVLSEAPRDQAYILIHDINFDSIIDARAQIPYLKDLDEKLKPSSVLVKK